MFARLPTSSDEFMSWSWQQIQPYYRDLTERPLSADVIAAWLADWTRLQNLVYETYSRLHVATTCNTADKEAEERYNWFLEEIYPRSEAAAQELKQKLLASGLEPEGFEVPLRNMRAEAELFREENLPLLSEEQKLGSEYDKIIGAQTVEWEGRELTLTQLHAVCEGADREVRERAWRLASQRRLADREAINAIWQKLLDVRRRLAANAGLPDYRSYRWRQLLRFDYAPEDCARFHQAIQEVVVPAATRIYERHRRRLGLETLRPWDLDHDFYAPSIRPLRPFTTVDELESKASAMLHRVDPQLGAYFEMMRKEKLLDLDNRKAKAPGGYCTTFPARQRPFIFMNAVGLHSDIQTLLHEAGHAFHVFESNHLPYYQQHEVGAEFAEVASMSMELLAAPYLPAAEGGFYSTEDAAIARVQHLEHIILFWPYMAVVDAFQHWAYEHAEDAADPARCDRVWAELWQRFMPGVDWSGLETEMMTGWHRKLHIYRYPFYYVEYGMAQLGAVQVWSNALQDQHGAVARYRQALALGGTVSLPALYEAAGARLAFDTETLRRAVDLIESTIEQLTAK